MKHRAAGCFRKLKATIHISYVIVLGLMWADECFDLPYLLKIGPQTPPNYAESLLESAAVIVIWFITIRTCKGFLTKIKVLEGLLPICSACKKIGSNGQWHEIDAYISEESEADFTHSLCPDCLRKLYPEIADSVLKQLNKNNNS
ncbi:hypothetical protein [Tichowtungia aerotolerans]|uniref:Uncharacterized protein n=1 Tax=Tichowtungia aerotolerans TaxID=2697043 RepID=A0A6P1M9J6_9BACT|nr:hypothetical protein [Tichowtungia aerotolerans]QHI70577.1 hypothetical protein GT409_14385 [Tichowtungia aerotolerans]